jgi:hypothetical protein
MFTTRVEPHGWQSRPTDEECSVYMPPQMVLWFAVGAPLATPAIRHSGISPVHYTLSLPHPRPGHPACSRYPNGRFTTRVEPHGWQSRPTDEECSVYLPPQMVLWFAVGAPLATPATRHSGISPVHYTLSLPLRPGHPARARFRRHRTRTNNELTKRNKGSILQE